MNFLEPHPAPAVRPAMPRPRAPRAHPIIICCVVLLMVGGAVFLSAAATIEDERLTGSSKIFEGVQVDGIPLGGLTGDRAHRVLAQTVHARLAGGLSFLFEGRTIVLGRASSTAWITFRFNQAVTEALHVGRTGSPWRDVLTRWRLRLHPVSMTMPVVVDEMTVTNEIRSQLKDVLVSVQDAQLAVTVPRGRRAAAQITVTPEQIGLALDPRSALEALHDQATRLSFSAIPLSVIRIQPSITAQDIQPLTDNVPAWLAHAPFALQAEKQTWIVTSSTLAGWLNVITGGRGFMLGLDPQRVQTSLRTIASDFLKPAQNGELDIENGVMKKFIAPIEGIDVDTDATVNAIQSGWAVGSATMPLVLVHTVPEVLGDEARAMGIREMLGVGRSNFAGSPVNRRKNIAHGAAKVNGVLVKPDEEFSLLQTLGDVDAKNNWLPELVIKGDKTEPDFGGGLCQIGTTTFRAALDSGLPITVRQNHSYRVPYYEPAGTDATIFSPAPDFRFKNDTGRWILLTTEMKGNELTFTFWGARDGRTVHQTTPKVFNFVQPPEKKIIETLDLKPGETKCTEKAHVGADASFDYAVTYPDGQAKKVTFRSHYKPWGAVCLLGVKQLTATSTVSGVDETGVNNPN